MVADGCWSISLAGPLSNLNGLVMMPMQANGAVEVLELQV